MAYELAPEGLAPYVLSEASLSEDGAVYKTFHEADAYIISMTSSTSTPPEKPAGYKEFPWSEFDSRPNSIIHCETEAEATALCEIFNMRGRHYADGTSYMSTAHGKYFGANLGYTASGHVDGVSECKDAGGYVYEFTDYFNADDIKEHDADFREEPNFVRYTYARLIDENHLAYLKTCSEDETSYEYETCWEASVRMRCPACKLALLLRPLGEPRPPVPQPLVLLQSPLRVPRPARPLIILMTLRMAISTPIRGAFGMPTQTKGIRVRPQLPIHWTMKITMS